MAAKKKIVEPAEAKVYVREKTVKELAVDKLLARGINATLESGVVMTKVKTPDELKIYKQALKDIGYNASWGAKIIKGDKDYEAERTVESTQGQGTEDYN